MSETLTVKNKLRSALETTAKTVAGIAFLGVAYLGLADSNLDAMGDLPKQIPKSELMDNAQEHLREEFVKLPPASQIAIQYAGATLPSAEDCTGPDPCIAYGGEIQSKNITSGSSILGGIGNYFSRPSYFEYGQACLAGTGYDTTPSELRVGGFASGGGDISAVATVNPDPDGIGIRVLPASGTGDALHFYGVKDGTYKPANAATEGVLSAYGCDPYADAFKVRS